MNESAYKYYTSNIIAIFTTKQYRGWGRKQRGKFGLWCQKNFGGTLTLLEDGFIRSVGLGVEGSPSFSVVKDNVGIYYDATCPSQLENILNTYDFFKDTALMNLAYEAIDLIKKHEISKYNNATQISDELLEKLQKNSVNVLIVAQTATDASLMYGLAGTIDTKQIIEDAMIENPAASVYIKIHPDVLSGKRKSDIHIEDIPKNCTIIDENINPIGLLKHMNKVYTKTSGIGMEALILEKEVVCYGLPYYAGWGLTQDKQTCNRRIRQLTMQELFAGAYILYTHYYNPYEKRESNIIDVINSIVKYRDL